MIEEAKQPEKHINQQDHDFQDEVDTAVRKFEDLLRLGAAEKGVTIRATVKRDTPNQQEQLESLLKRAATKKQDFHRSRKALLLRGVEAMTRELGQIDAEQVDQLLQSSDNKLLVGFARIALEDTPADRLDRMTLRGTERFQNLIEGAGGSVTSAWVAELLGASEEAVRKRVGRRTLIARRIASGELSFPRFQFDEQHQRLLPGLSDLLSATKAWSPEEIIRFLLVRHNPKLSDDTPLTLLERGDRDSVLALAAANRQQRP